MTTTERRLELSPTTDGRTDGPEAARQTERKEEQSKARQSWQCSPPFLLPSFLIDDDNHGKRFLGFVGATNDSLTHYPAASLGGACVLVAVDRSSVGNHAFGVMRGHPNKFDCMQAHTLRKGGTE